METKEQILQSKQIVSQEKRRIMKHRKLLCQMGPVGYWLSLHKEYLLRDIKNLLSRERFATKIDPSALPGQGTHLLAAAPAAWGGHAPAGGQSGQPADCGRSD